MILNIINKWWIDSSYIEKVLAFFIGFFIGDLVNELLYKYLSIDSFIITTISGIFSLFLTFFIFQIVKDKFKKSS